MEQGPRQQQTPVNHGGVLPRQEVCHGHHIGSMHQQPRQEAVMDAFGRRDAGKGLQMPLQHGPRHLAVVGILHGVHQCADLADRLVLVDGGSRHQPGGIAVVLRQGHADIGQGQLGISLEFGHVSPNFNDFPHILLGAHRPGVVPDLHIHGAGLVRDHRAQKRLAVGGYLLVGLL